MDADDLEPGRKKPAPTDFEVMSVEALRDYIAELELEIERAKSAITIKKSARAGADNFFKS